MAQQMKSVTRLMEVVFAQMDTMENYANLVSTYCKKLCQLPMKVRENLSWDDLSSFITKFSNKQKYLQSVSVKTA
jgi:hypothetical protein